MGNVRIYSARTCLYAEREKFPILVLLLLDLKLPRRSGLEVLQWLRRQPGLKRLPVVVRTSSQDITDIDRAYDLGVNSYLVKSGDFDPLLHVVKALGRYWIALNEKPNTDKQ